MGKLNLVRIASIVVPLGCLIAVGTVVYRQVLRIRSLENERTVVDRDIATVDAALRKMMEMPAPPRRPTEVLTRQEQSQFLNEMRSYAAATRVRIARWTNSTPIAPIGSAVPPPPPSSGGARPPGVPPGVTAIASGVEVVGPYRSVRAVLYALQCSRRLFSINDIKWLRGDKWPNTSVSFTLTRYVSPRSAFGEAVDASAPGVPPAAGPSAAAATGGQPPYPTPGGGASPTMQ